MLRSLTCHRREVDSCQHYKIGCHVGQNLRTLVAFYTRRNFIFRQVIGEKVFWKNKICLISSPFTYSLFLFSLFNSLKKTTIRGYSHQTKVEAKAKKIKWQAIQKKIKE